MVRQNRLGPICYIPTLSKVVQNLHVPVQHTARDPTRHARPGQPGGSVGYTLSLYLSIARLYTYLCSILPGILRGLCSKVVMKAILSIQICTQIVGFFQDIFYLHLHPMLCLPFLSLCLFIHLFVCLPFQLSLCLSLHLSNYLYVFRSTCLLVKCSSIYKSTHPFIYQFIYLFINVSIF